MIRTLLLIGLGGGLGSIFRYLTSLAVGKLIHHTYPFPTFAVNIIGCFLIGLLIGFFERMQLPNPNLKYLLITGFCGGYTTFSTFTSENWNLIQSGNVLLAILYISASIILGLLAIYAGIIIAK